jgi:hypothetical protein
MTEAEITKLLAKAKITLVKQERVPEAERKYTFERKKEGGKGQMETVESEIVYRFYLPNRTDDPWVERDLWCMKFADGTLSDLGNLTRIKDAAVAHANRILGDDK